MNVPLFLDALLPLCEYNLMLSPDLIVQIQRIESPGTHFQAIIRGMRLGAIGKTEEWALRRLINSLFGILLSQGPLSVYSWDLDVIRPALRDALWLYRRDYAANP